ncbi:MAG: M23 family metallopeptidase [Saprospiraceae bacterium]
MYWTVTEFSEGPAVIDFNVSKYDGGQWKQGSSSKETDSYDYLMPLYSPANGEICSCWRNFPNENGPKVFTGGNHVVIKTEDNQLISIAHLAPGTLDAKLCPPNDDATVYPSDMTKEGFWRVASYIPPGQRPKIKEGQFIGKVGSSGNSSGPHLHMSSSPVTGTDSKGREAAGDAVPMRFRNAWGHAYVAGQNVTPSGWYRYINQQFTNNGFKIVHPSPYLIRDQKQGEKIKKTDIAFVSETRAVTASIAANNKAKLTSWNITGLAVLAPASNLELGLATNVRIISGLPGQIVVGTHEGSGDLKLALFEVQNNGSFVKKSEQNAGKVANFELIRLAYGAADNYFFATVIRDGSNSMKLIAWDLNPDGTIVKKGTALGAGQTTTSVTACRSRTFKGIYTAERNQNGDLEVTPFRIAPDGMSFIKGKSLDAGGVSSKISIAPLAQGACVAMVDADNNTRFITMQASAAGDIVERNETLVLTGAQEVSVLSTPVAESNLTAVVKDAENRLRIIGLLMNDDGTDLRRIGTSVGNPASQIMSDAISKPYSGNSNRDLIITAYINSSGNLELATWDTNMNNP